MAKKFLFPASLLLLILMGVYLFYQIQTVQRIYKTEVLRGLSRNRAIKNSILTERDIQSLPGPLQRYLRYTGALGRGKVRNVKINFEGIMKLDPKQGWTKVKSEQYNFLDRPTRLFTIRASRWGIPFIGLDSYIKGKGNMLIKVAGLFTVANAKGVEVDMGEMVTLFDDICLYSPAALIDKRFGWETIDAFKVKGTFHYKGRKVSATLSFNEEGQLINFVTDDRFFSPTGKTFQRIRWSTPVRDYQDVNGIKIPAYGEGIWHFKAGDYCYAKFGLRNIEYNSASFQ